MKFLYAIALVIIFFPAQLLAQANFKPGYVVNLKGDTTRGFVDYREWNESPQRISFKPSQASVVQQYSAGEINAFGADMLEQYKSYTGPLTTATVELRDLSVGIDSSSTNGNVFLRTLFIGKKLSFYSYNDKIKTRYFISERNGMPVELRRYVYLDIKQSDKIREYNYYIQQLLAYAIKYQPANAELEVDINKVAYKGQALQDIVLRIDGSDVVYKVKSINKGGYRFFVGAGANVVKNAFSMRKAFSAMNGIFNTNMQTQSVAPAITGGIDLYFNKNIGKLIFRVEGNLSYNDIKAHYKGVIYDGFREIGGEEDLSVTQITLGANPQMIYNVFNGNDLKFFIGVGANFGFSKFTNQRFHIKNYFNGKLEGERDFKVPYRFPSTNISSRLGITIKRKIDIYAGYYLPASITDNASAGVDVSFYRFGVNYFFNLK